MNATEHIAAPVRCGFQFCRHCGTLISTAGKGRIYPYGARVYFIGWLITRDPPRDITINLCTDRKRTR